MANLGDITPEMPKTSYTRVKDDTEQTEREDYQEDWYPRRERPVPRANQAEGHPLRVISQSPSLR